MAFGASPAQTKAVEASTSNGTITFDSAIAAGSLIVIMARFNVASASLTGPSGYSTPPSQPLDQGGTQCIGVWYKIAGASESTTVTFTHAAVFHCIEGEVWLGAARTPLDTQSGVGTAVVQTSWQPGSVTPSMAGCLVVTACNQGASNGGEAAPPIDSSFTASNAATFSRLIAGWRVMGAASAVNPASSWTTPRACTAVAAVFKPLVTVAATLAAPLGGLSATLAATPKVLAVLSAPLGGLSASATATPSHPATLAAPLGGLTAAATAGVSHPATLAAPLGQLQATVNATTGHPATLNAPLGGLVATAAGTVGHPSVFAAPLGALTAAATATPTVHATLSAPLGGLNARIVPVRLLVLETGQLGRRWHAELERAWGAGAVGRRWNAELREGP